MIRFLKFIIFVISRLMKNLRFKEYFNYL